MDSPPTLTRKDFVTDQEVRWCPGCGDYAILAAAQQVFPKLGIPREKFVIVSGIGCSSRFPYYVESYGFHTIHGRAPAFATGIKLANPELDVWLVTGDGDGMSIGGNHTMHILRRNVNVQILLFNNEIYGLTKGQFSPTSREGTNSPTSPLGSVDRPASPCAFALGSGALERIVRLDQHARGIVTSVFERFQTFDEDGDDITLRAGGSERVDEHTIFEACGLEHAIEKLACAAYEGLSLGVLVSAGAFTDDHQRGVAHAAREHGLLGALALEGAAVKGGDGGGEAFEILASSGGDLGCGDRRRDVGRARCDQPRPGDRRWRGRLAFGAEHRRALSEAINGRIGVQSLDPCVGPKGQQAFGGALIDGKAHATVLTRIVAGLHAAVQQKIWLGA